MSTAQTDLKTLLAAAKLNLDRNVASCDTQIASLNARVLNAEFSGEDAADLKKRLTGYKDKRKELLAEEPS